MKRAVCLLSGGLDSCVAAYIAKNQGFEVITLHITYGQRHQKERECAAQIAKELKVRKHFELSVPLDQFGGSSLLQSTERKIPDRVVEEIGAGVPSTYVPARNTVFLSVGLSLAEAIDADALFIGANAVDYSGYPDCRPAFIEAFQRLSDVGTKRGIEGRSIMIHAPLLQMTKKEIVERGVKLHVPFDITWSCYRGDRMACGRCDSCLLRLKGFQEAGKKDPLKYQGFPSWYH